MSASGSNKLEFAIFCIENIAEALGRFYESREYHLLSNGISDQHCMTPDYIVDDILNEKGQQT